MMELDDNLNNLLIINLNDVLHAETILRSVGYSLQNEKTSKAAVLFINKQLATAVSRDKGFEVLYKLLPYCPSHIIKENCIQWANFTVNHHPTETVPPRRLQVLVEILKVTNTNQEFQKFLTSHLLSKIVETCIAVHPKGSVALYALDCLNVCMKTYSSTCIVYKKKIESFALSFLDSPCTASVLEQAGACLHYTNQVGGAGPGGSIHIKNYTETFEKFCHTLLNLQDKLFEDINEFENFTSDASKRHEFRELPTNLNTSEVYRILARRLRNVIGFLRRTLECDFPVSKTFPPNLLISAIKRGMSVHTHFTDGASDKILFATILQEHQIDLLHLLKALLISLKQNFTRFLSIKYLQEYLTRTKSCDCFNLNSEYIVSVYEVLKYWIQNSGEYIETVTYDKIVRNITADITPVKASLVLNMSKVDNKSKKAKTKAVEEKIIKSGEITRTESALKLYQSSETICFNALSTLELLLKKICLNVKENTSAILFEMFVKLLLDHSVNIFEPPYTIKKCRVMLLKVFVAIFDQNIACLDLGLAINILCLHQSSNDTEISNICTEGLSSLEKLCQPTHPSLYINYENNKNSKDKKEDAENLDCRQKEHDFEEKILINGSFEEEITEENFDENVTKRKHAKIEENVMDLINGNLEKSDGDQNLPLEDDLSKNCKVTVLSDIRINTQCEVLSDNKPKKIKMAESSSDELKMNVSNEDEMKNPIDEDMMDSFVDEIIND